MSPKEFWIEFDDKIREQKRMKKGLGGHSVADWEDARRRHKAKMQKVKAE